MITSHVPRSARIVASGDVVASEFGDELVILDLRSGVYYGLEDVGARVWKMVQRPTSLPDICDAIVAEYDVDTTRCEREVGALVAELARTGLVEIREAP